MDLLCNSPIHSKNKFMSCLDNAWWSVLMRVLLEGALHTLAARKMGMNQGKKASLGEGNMEMNGEDK